MPRRKPSVGPAVMLLSTATHPLAWPVAMLAGDEQ